MSYLLHGELEADFPRSHLMASRVKGAETAPNVVSYQSNCGGTIAETGPLTSMFIPRRLLNSTRPRPR